MNSFRFFAVVVFIFSVPAFAGPDWMTLIAQGRDHEAALEFGRVLKELPGNADPDLIEYFQKTVKTIDTGCKECAEKEKIFLFRKIASGYEGVGSLQKSDLNVGTADRPFFPSRALMTPQKNKALPDGLKRVSRYNLIDIVEQHVTAAGKGVATYSPFISTTFATELKANMLVLKVCPNRILLNTMSRFGEEYELLLPLLIHPNEVVAILGLPKEKTKEYSLVFNGLTTDEAETVKIIKNAAATQSRAVTAERSFSFNTQFIYYMKYREPLTRTRYHSQKCSKLFEYLVRDQPAPFSFFGKSR